MHGIEKRDYHRIDDAVGVTYTVISAKDVERTTPEDHFNLPASFMLLRELYALSLEAEEVLRGISEEDRKLGSFLHNVNRRVELIAQATIERDLDSRAMTDTARISEGGVSFVTSELLSAGSFVALQMLFRPELLGLVSFGEVRHCRLSEDGENYVAGVRFVNTDHIFEKLISRHIIHRQSVERRRRLQRDVFE